MELDEASTRLFVRISSIAYPMFLSSTLLTQSLLILFIFCCSPPHISFLRMLLLKTALLQVLVTVILFLIQPRLLAGVDVNVPVFCYGVCRKWNSSRLCFALYHTWQTLSLAVATSLTYTLYFKYYKLKSYQKLSRVRLFVSMFIAYIPCFVSMACGVVIVLRNTLPDEMAKRKEDVEEAEYTVMGRMRLGEVPNRINFAMLCIGIYVAPVVALWFRWRAHKSLNEKIDGSSSVLKFHAKTMMNGLTIQVVTHFVFYIPLFSLYFFSLLTGQQFLFQQFFLTMFPNLTAISDPLINLYYVIPYRNRIRSCCGFRIVQVVPASITPTF